ARPRVARRGNVMDDYDEMDPLNADDGGGDEAQNPQNAHNSPDVGPRGGGEAQGDNAAGQGADAPAPNDGEAGNDDPDSFDDAEPTPGLSHKQEQAILALLAEPTVARAAKVAKVGVRTLHRWLREEAFGKAYRLARRESFAQAVSLTQRYAALAVQTLAKVMSDDSAPVASRVAAATSMLKFARDSIELDDLADRVEALERSTKEKAAMGAAA
ncbi:MAG: hypothetical protein KF699_14400, partial [Phycisphaeraceae bacterium]|nr:hypothetical protein [Phycisphaeraceae bacterium]